MELVLKACGGQDLERASELERAVMPDHCYLREAWPHFSQTPGELTVAYVGDEMVGMGRFTVLFDHTGWLETLRVHPDWQGKGVGKAIYGRYLEQAADYGCPSMAMYTGASNQQSAGLARRYGLETVQTFREYALPVSDAPADEPGFVPATPSQAAALLDGISPDYHGYAVLNRTFYRLNQDTLMGFADVGWVYVRPDTGDFAILGARFQPDRGLHVAVLGGDWRRGLAFARGEAARRKAGRLVCNFALENSELEQLLQGQGFRPTGGDLMTMERRFV